MGLTQSQVEAFHQNGYLVVEDAWDAAKADPTPRKMYRWDE